MMEWHRLFGLTLTDYFTDSSYSVELEKDLSLKQQFLDVVIIERKNGIPLSEMPDGFEYLAVHNLVTYKSLRESLDDWTIEELIGHYVNYRKQVSPSLNELLPAGNFRLYAVCTLYPKNLAKQTEFITVKKGIYDLIWGIRRIRIIVTSRIPHEKTKRGVAALQRNSGEGTVRSGALQRKSRRDEQHYESTLFKI